MNTAPFYELHDRLYDCAYAGCASVTEDFRLKRAVENMAPLAEANKTFARLRDMCARLFTESEPALLLADCIALADALAVAQGGFTSSETARPSDLQYDVRFNKQAGWRSVKPLWVAILTKSQHLKELYQYEYDLLGDPRILEQFICASGEKSENIAAFAREMCAAYGTSIVPLLKGDLDLSDEKASGMQVDYVAETAGSAENDWYLSLAENENAPQNVRIKAIQALARDSANAPRLLDFCRTEKGRVKSAALLETARLDPPGFDEILAKLTAKYKDSYLPIMCASPSGVAVDFIRSRLDEAFDGAKQKKYPGLDWLLATINIMHGKRDIDDCFLRMAELIKMCPENAKGGRALWEMNCVLIDELFCDPDGSFKEMIYRLHRQDPESFSRAWCVILLEDDPESAAAELKRYMNDSIYTLIENGIRYSEQHGRYVLDSVVSLSHAPSHDRNHVIPLFERMPRSYVKLYGEYYADANSKSVEYLVRSHCMLLKHAMDTAAPDDVILIKEQVLIYARTAFWKMPLLGLMKLILKCDSPDSKTVFKMFRSYAMSDVNVPHSIMEIANTTYLTAEQKRSILEEMIDKVLTNAHFSEMAKHFLNELTD